MNQPALFLDRDGVIIENRPNYVRTWEQVELLPGALEALAAVRAAPFKVFIVTNQSGVGRGLIPVATAETINARLVSVIEANGGRIDQVYMCPHAPDDRCSCRKPLPGMLLEAAARHQIDLGRSILIGDALTDLQAGHAAGIPTAGLVRTGRGAQQERLPLASRLNPFQVYEDLAAALDDLIVQNYL